ncbi:GNAT family N-acetyltransferase [Streptomyces sp. NPDC097619]|uniref:GNAT family N-acetyltransferase n=1 Tax=Streptomyces sp. NPDC097619 TaxID=3157228 RepID=UPI00333153E8
MPPTDHERQAPAPALTVHRPEDERALADWRHVHNAVIPAHPLSAEEVRERAGRNHLEVAHLDGVLVGCTTVRPPAPAAPGNDDDTGDGAGGTATVIARILPEHRGRGLGTLLYDRSLALARSLGAREIETVVLSSNPDGLRFALRQGFTETERYLLPGDTVPWIDLRLTDPPAPRPAPPADPTPPA